MDNTNLMKWHIAAVKMILSLDEPILPADNALMNFYLQATMGTCQIIKLLCNTEEKK